MTEPRWMVSQDRVVKAGLKSSLNNAILTALVYGDAARHSQLQGILLPTRFALVEAVSIDLADNLHLAAPHLDLIILDAKQDVPCLLDTVKHVRGQFPDARIVALADEFELRIVALGHKMGVNAFCPAASPPEVLIGYLELMLAGQNIVHSRVLRSAIALASSWGHRPAENKLRPLNRMDLEASKLSRREMQILDCLKEGSSNKLIARRLDITEATIKVHVKAILRKIGAANRTQAAMWACQNLSHETGAMTNA